MGRPLHRYVAKHQTVDSSDAGSTRTGRGEVAISYATRAAKRGSAPSTPRTPQRSPA